MELSNGNTIARFIMALFILLTILILSPMLHSMVGLSKADLSCSTTYSVTCFAIDAALPVLVIVCFGLLISYFKGNNQ